MGMPFWCMSQAAAAIARAASEFGVQRATWSVLLSGLAPSLKGCLIMEALVVALLLPCILKRFGRLLPLLLFLAVPCIAVFVDGDLQDGLQPYLAAPETMHRASVALCVISFMCLFMTGVNGVAALALVAQLFMFIHKLDTVKI